jgi:hypothetical protein
MEYGELSFFNKLSERATMKTIIFLLTVLLFFSCEASGGNPAPYTEEAYKKIESASKNTVFEHDENFSKEELARKNVEWERKIFEKAGYNYDDTIIKVVDDMKHTPERLPKNPESVPMIIFTGVHIMMSHCEYDKVDCLQFFSSDTAEAIKWLMENTDFSF